ncbi:hypothetical protein BDV93DRAFT_511342 [Ceratobasidium sp. AG-I]|nr:hypothetical protein BDV93DRAFT_511342 [Ceratobasidium sp. AG-I]
MPAVLTHMDCPFCHRHISRQADMSTHTENPARCVDPLVLAIIPPIPTFKKHTESNMVHYQLNSGRHTPPKIVDASDIDCLVGRARAPQALGGAQALWEYWMCTADNPCATQSTRDLLGKEGLRRSIIAYMARELSRFVLTETLEYTQLKDVDRRGPGRRNIVIFSNPEY